MLSKCLLKIEIFICSASISMSMGHLFKLRKRNFHNTISKHKFHLLQNPLKLHFIINPVIIILPSITYAFKRLFNFPNKFFIPVVPLDDIISKQLVHSCNSHVDQTNIQYALSEI